MQVATKYPDIFFTPEYSELFKDTAFGGEPCHCNCAGIDYRFYKRPIAGTDYFDIVSPYGYSGPVGDGDNNYWHTFAAAFMNCCEGYGIIAEFARLNPFITQTLPYGKHHYEHDIFYIDLTKSEDEIWKGFDKGCRSAIKKAIGDIKMPVRRVEPSFVSLEFTRLYNQTMKECKSKDDYLFDDAFWYNLQRIGTFFRCYSVAPLYGEGLAVACLLKYGDYCHYFLSASNGDNSGATNLLIWEAIKWAKSQGCKIFNLGGGLKTGDSLESFKRSFSHDSKPFYTYRKIHSPEIYNQICANKGIDPAKESYFPAYRTERTKQ